MSPKSACIPALLIIMLWGFSCSESGPPAGDEDTYAYRVTEVEGVRTVTNPENPWKGRIPYEAIEEVSIGEEFGEEPYLLNKPIDIKVDSQGRIYVMDWGDTHIRVYDAEGTYLRTIGRKGQGPGEFDSPCYFDIGPDDLLYLMDGRNQRVTVFTLEGEHIKDFRVKGFYSRMACDSQCGIYVQNQTTQKEIYVSDALQEIPMLTSLHRIDVSTGEQTLIGDFEGEKQMMRRTKGGGFMAIQSPFTLGWGISPSGKLWAGFNEAYELAVYSLSGDLEFRCGRDFTPLPNPRIKADWAPKTFPAFSTRRLVFDEKGNLWLAQYTAEEFEGILYDVFSPEGVYLRQAVVPFQIYIFEHGRAYSLVIPEDGFPMVKRFRLKAQS